MSTTHEIPVLEANVRQRIGSRDAARLREAGRMPAVIYGLKQEPKHISLDAKKTTDLLVHQAHVIDINIDGASDHCLVKSVQWDHLGSTIIHVDLERVNLDQQVEVEIEVELTGEAPGLKEAGAVLDQVNHTVLISCKPAEVPEHLKLDISDLNVGDTKSVSDVVLPDGVTLAEDDPEKVVCTISVQAEIEEEEPAEAADGEPEVITEKKEEGEG